MLQTGWTEGGKIRDTKRNAPALRGKERAVKCFDKKHGVKCA